MQTFALQNGDIYVSKGQIAIVNDDQTHDQVAQTIGTRLKTILGEFFYNINFGLPYWEVIANAANIDVLNVAMKNMIASTEGVTKINSFNSNLDTVKRVYKVDFSISTVVDDTQQTIQTTKSFQF